MYGETLEVVYTWPDGREEVRYRRQINTLEADLLIKEVEALQATAEYFGETSPYSFRFV